MSSQTENPTKNILDKLHGVKEVNGGWQARCPAHDDEHSSLSINEGSKGECLLFCHAGCMAENILRSIGLEMKHLYPGKQVSSNRSSGMGKIVATYQYADTEGNPLFQVLRYEPKDFRQRRKGENGGWIWKVLPQTKVPYNLKNVKHAIDTDKVIFVVEGEKDVHSLATLKLCGTCNPGGAEKWLSSYNKYLDGAHVVILPDNDDAGRRHRDKVAQSLQGHAAEVRIVELPGLSKGGDVSDWIQAGGTFEELQQLVEAAPQWEPTPDGVFNPDTPPATFGYPCTDMGNGERFVSQHGKNAKYVVDWKSWITWDGTRWTHDETLAIEQLAKSTVRSIYAEAAAETDDKKRKMIADWAVSSESAQRLNAMLLMARSEVAIVSDVLDTDKYLLCVQNGTLDLRTGELLTPRRENYITKLTPIEYDPAAKCPTWIAFLDRVQPEPEARGYIQRCMGYSLTGDVSEDCLFFLYGEGRNGKSTTLEILKSLVGREYFKKVDADMLMFKSSRNAAETKSDLVGRRVISSTEIAEGQRLNEGLIKDLTGGDTQDARRLYCQSRDFTVGFHIWLYGNHHPAIRGRDTGIWSRIRLIPFAVVIPEAERDKHLKDKLHSELSGILTWTVKGCLDWQANGLQEPEAVLDATNEYRREQDGLLTFLADSCIFGREFIVTKKALWEAYQAWIKDNGDEAYTSQKYFNDDVKQRPGVKEIRIGHAQNRGWRGVGLQTDTPDNADCADAADSKQCNFLANESHEATLHQTQSAQSAQSACVLQSSNLTICGNCGQSVEFITEDPKHSKYKCTCGHIASTLTEVLINRAKSGGEV